MQAVATATLDVSGVVIQRKGAASNAGNGIYTAPGGWSTIATVAGGWAKPSANVMQQYAAVIGSAASWVVRLPYGTDCKANDQIVMPTGEKLRVQADLSQSSYSTCKRVLATEIRPN